MNDLTTLHEIDVSDGAKCSQVPMNPDEGGPTESGVPSLGIYTPDPRVRVTLQCQGALELLDEARTSYREVLRFNAALNGDLEPGAMGTRLARLEWSLRALKMRLEQVGDEETCEVQSRELLAESSRLNRWIRYYSDFGRIARDGVTDGDILSRTLMSAAEARFAGDLQAMGELLDLSVAYILGGHSEGGSSRRVVSIFESSDRFSSAAVIG